jgi:putative addiction module component (TIGR02574 family)
MPATIQSLGIDKLSRDERIALVMDIWDTIAAEPAPSNLTEAQLQEIRRRVAEDKSNPGERIAWEQVKEKALRRLKT